MLSKIPEKHFQTFAAKFSEIFFHQDLNIFNQCFNVIAGIPSQE